MKDYQKTKDNIYLLPQTVYRQALYAIKDLDRLRGKLFYLEEVSSSLKSIDPSELFFCGGSVSDVTGDLASEMAQTETRIRAIEKAFRKIPEKYRRGIEDKLIYDVPYDESQHCINTWKKWQQVLIYHVATNLQIL